MFALRKMSGSQTPAESETDVEMVVTVSLSALRFEESFLQGLENVSLPATFNVIYQEGIRGNHILFNEEDIARFSDRRLGSRTLENDRNAEQVEEIFYSILMSSSYSEMQEIISKQEFIMKRKIFQLYLRFVSQWSEYLKKSLN